MWKIASNSQISKCQTSENLHLYYSINWRPAINRQSGFPGGGLVKLPTIVRTTDTKKKNKYVFSVSANENNKNIMEMQNILRAKMMSGRSLELPGWHLERPCLLVKHFQEKYS